MRPTIGILLVATTVLAACSSDGGDEALGDDRAALTAIDNGAGAGKALLDSDPCANPRAFADKHKYHLVIGKPGDAVISGTSGRDLIVGTAGDDVIRAGAGDDIVCAGYGEDHVEGGAGDDYLDGGGDNDVIHGDDGNDTVHGRGGSDVIFGGDGDDLLFGDILDDKIFGEGGDDLLIGGHGTDILDGGPGNDYLRGDTGNDAFIGRAGTDVASFITAMPPGQPELVGKPANKASGVRVDFKDTCAEAGDVGGRKLHDGCANGDGGNEPLDSIEIVVGSPYDDVFTSDAQPTKFLGGYGNDTCDGNACGQALPAGADNAVLAYVDAKARDMGVVLRGRDASDNVDVFWENGHVRVRSQVGTPLLAGPGCRADGPAVVCSPNHVLRYVAAWMGDGNDVAKLGEAAGAIDTFPLDFTAHVSGGDGDDFLHGGDEQDVFFSGPTGADHLLGNNGDDALLSESRKWPKKDNCSPADEKTDPRCTEDKPKAAQYTDGRDELHGGPGDDQLVTDYPCGNHFNSGGPGKDIAGFARSGRFPLHAQLAGAADVDMDFHGRAFNPALCGKDDGTRFDDDLEILEAADGDDLLYGNNADNIIWGREGDDRIHGLGGDDTLEGLLGDDMLYGGRGNDKLLGAGGNDQLFPDAD